jgi:hypothetical protein
VTDWNEGRNGAFASNREVKVTLSCQLRLICLLYVAIHYKIISTGLLANVLQSLKKIFERFNVCPNLAIVQALVGFYMIR